MNVTYLVTIVLPDAMDPASIANTAMDIEDDLMSNFEVVSVTPWARPSLGLDQLASAPEAPPPLF
jgi:hypothetical protein